MTNDWELARKMTEGAERFSTLVEDNERLEKQIDLKDSAIEDLTQTVKEQSTKIQDLEYQLSQEKENGESTDAV